MQRQRKKTRTTWETDEEDGHLGGAAPKSASSSMSSFLGMEELQRYSPLTSVPAPISLAGREPKEGSRVENPGAESIKAGGEPGHIGPEESMNPREHCQESECFAHLRDSEHFAHFNISDSLEVHSTNSLEVHSTTHLSAETSIFQFHFECEALESIQQNRHLPQGLAKSRTGAKNESDGENDFEIPECWRETEKTKFCRFTAFIKLMFNGVTGARRVPSDEAANAETPGGVQTKIEDDIENDIENGLKSSKAKIDSDENSNGGDVSENFKAKIGSDENFEGGGSFGKSKIS